MKSLYLAFLIIVFSFMCSNARVVVFRNVSGNPIPEVVCVGLSQDMDSIASWISDRQGRIDVDNTEVAYLLASRDGYSERLVTLASLQGDTVTMSTPVALQEVLVTPDDTDEFATHESYRIPIADFNRYANVFQAMNEIPNLTVLSNGALFYEGNQNVKLLINGVDATRQEVMSLSKEDISRIDVYRTPPPRFAAQGIASVVDIRLKSKLHGGNGSLNISQAFHPVEGENSAAVYYNYRQSRFSILYNNTNRHYRNLRQSEVLEYDFDGVNYIKNKQGLDSKDDRDNNNVRLSYQINRPGSFLYNVNGGVSANSSGREYNQNVCAGGIEFPASNYLHTRFTRYRVGNYIEKNFGNGSTLLGNIAFQHYSTSYDSRYRETGGNSSHLEDSQSRYSTGLNAVMSEFQYELPKTKAGYFTVVAYEVFNRSKYHNTATPYSLENNKAGGMLQWMGSRRRVQWFVLAGIDWYHTVSSRLGMVHDLIIPNPAVNINWRPFRKFRINLEYSLRGMNPSIAQLSETEQWLDNRLVYHGNAKLKPYRTHNAGISFVFNNKYLNLSLKGMFESSKGMICDMYTRTEEYMLQTLVNLDRYRVWSSQADITIKPLGNNRLTFWNRIIAADLDGKNSEYSWHGYRFQWMSTISLNLDRWTAELYYQYPGKIVEGQLERPRAECWSATVLYRPVPDLSVGLEWFMPFGRGMREREYTVNSAPVYADTEIFVRDKANMLSLKLSYNFTFGRNKNRARPQYDNVNDDSGILTK